MEKEQNKLLKSVNFCHNASYCESCHSLIVQHREKEKLEEEKKELLR